MHFCHFLFLVPSLNRPQLTNGASAEIGYFKEKLVIKWNFNSFFCHFVLQFAVSTQIIYENGWYFFFDNEEVLPCTTFTFTKAEFNYTYIDKELYVIIGIGIINSKAKPSCPSPSKWISKTFLISQEKSVASTCRYLAQPILLVLWKWGPLHSDYCSCLT